MDRERLDLISDLAIAVLLAFVLGLAWTIGDWSSLSALWLPDTDDVMRLQQVRDWLGGQSWSDLTQYRLGAGVPMHWSRVADLGPALLITTATPLLGTHRAEVLAVTVWPILLFAGALLLVGRITRRLDPDAARTAMVIAAIAYPATTIFVPGRIDHHGLQLVLLLGATLVAIGKPTFRNGAITGALAATSLVIGMETMPFFAVLGAAALLAWAYVGRGGDARIIGLGVGTLTGLGIGIAGFASRQWRYPACDGFTQQAATGLAIMAIVPLAVAVLGRHIISVRVRLAIAAALSFGALSVVRLQSPACGSPYGQVPILLRRLWLDHVGEAQSIVTASFGVAFGYLGVMLAGVAASAWLVRRRPGRNAVLLLALQCTAVAIAAVQLRGAYTGAMLGAPALAIMIGAARRRGALTLVPAWILSTGMLYPIAAEAFVPSPRKPAPSASSCTSPQAIAALDHLSLGMVMAPIDVAPWGIAATPHAFVAGPYHRNTAGNVAMYRFFLGHSGQARAIADRWKVRYVVYCDSDFDAIQPAPDSMVHELASRRIPAWLKPLDPTGNRIFEVVP
ncbi:MAG: hypothetical protein DI640_02390 [Sphingomonas taxi]|uniref:Glycosyltransferase RgtA/B/C/D-like domain-containing protein n=1 Tax=Sphingomonas taxi TaxID=1549858 RepID=A0A2W4Z2A9_9SPHN|nr:MAG: hypothetical protein DI640_02390 [Sphingomonas taxi]